MLRECLDQLDIGLPRSAGRVDLERAMRVCQTPGVSITLVDAGQVTETVCAGVRELGGGPVSERTIFQAGSISKSVAAACALRLVADGVLDLDGDVNEGLRSWRIPANDGWRPVVTLRQLLAHTAGLTVSGLMGYPAGHVVPAVPDLLAGRGNSLPVVVTELPGLRFRYSGGGYVVMQQLLSDVTDTPFAELAAALVLEPVGMRDSTFAQPLPANRVGSASSGHHPGPSAVPGGWHTYPELAACGLWSTPTDLARFFLAIRASLAGQSDALLPPDIAAHMARQHTEAVPYGLGLRLADAGEPASIGHGGDDQGFQNYAVVYLESGHGLVVMTNSDLGSSLIYDIIVPAVTRHHLRPTPPVTPLVGDAQPGHYGDFMVHVDGEGLDLTFGNQPPLRLLPDGTGLWRADAINLDARFEQDTLVVTQGGEEFRHPATPRTYP